VRYYYRPIIIIDGIVTTTTPAIITIIAITTTIIITTTIAGIIIVAGIIGIAAIGGDASARRADNGDAKRRHWEFRASRSYAACGEASDVRRVSKINKELDMRATFRTVSRPPCAPLRRRRLSRATRRRGQSASRVRRLSRRHRHGANLLSPLWRPVLSPRIRLRASILLRPPGLRYGYGMGIPMLIPLCRRRCPCLFLDGEWTAASFRRPAAVFAWRQSPSKK